MFKTQISPSGNTKCNALVADLSYVIKIKLTLLPLFSLKGG